MRLGLLGFLSFEYSEYMENRGGSEELQFGGGERAAQPPYQETKTSGLGSDTRWSAPETTSDIQSERTTHSETPRPVNLPTVPESEPVGEDFDPSMVDKYDVTTLEAMLNDAMSNNAAQND